MDKFEHLDQDSDGQLTIHEMQDFDHSDGPALAKLRMQYWLYTLDTDGDHKISKEEWQSYVKRVLEFRTKISIELKTKFPQASDDQIDMVVSVFAIDPDLDGYLTLEKLKNIYHLTGDKLAEWEENFDQMDLDGNKKWEPHEFM